MDGITTFGQLLKWRRKDQDLTQAALAELASCSLDTVKKIESGVLRPSREMAEALASALDVEQADRPDFVRLSRAPLPSHNGRAGATAARPPGLPVPPTSIIGRERETGEVAGMLARDDMRLLTLTGPGGVGKTTLALEVAARSAPAFRDGAAFIDLSSIVDPALVASAIGRALGVRENPDRPLVDVLKAFLRVRQMLLVLDNFEQVEPAAPLVVQLLAAAPSLKVLATSRSHLHVRAERAFEVPALPVPGDNEQVTPDAIARFGAVRLFVDRAASIRPGFDITPENAGTIAAICRRLDGLPLAIELAAARVGALPPVAMLSRLDHSISLLTGGQYDLPERQRTLRGTIEWSHDLLGAGEQALFRRLSVFQGGRSLEAVEAVCTGGSPGSGVLDGLTSLVDMSLLREEEGVGGEPRYWMLEMIHEYARERLEESGEAVEMRLGHASYFLSLAERADPLLRGGQQRKWLDRLEAEHDNFRTALAWCARGEEYERVELGLRLVAALHWFWVRCGHMAEGRRWIDSMLFRAEAMAELRHSGAAARALSCAGVMAYLQGDRTGAESILDESLALYRETGGDPEGLARTLVYLGIAKGYMSRQRPAGLPLVAEGIALQRTLDDRWALARAVSFSGFLPLVEGDFATARALFEEALPMFEQTGDPWAIAWAKVITGEAARCQGDYDAAAVLDQQALAIQRDLGDRHSMAVTYNNLGYIALSRRDYAEAARCLRESISLFEQTASSSRALSGLAGLAAIALADGRIERAARLFGAASALGEAGRLTLEPPEQLVFERNLATLRERMDEAALQPLWSQGRAMTWEQAFACATGADDTSPPV